MFKFLRQPLSFFLPEAPSMKISEAIMQANSLNFPEHMDSYSECALGAAYWALMGIHLSGNSALEIHKKVAAAFRVSARLVSSIDSLHRSGASRKDIALSLKLIGY